MRSIRAANLADGSQYQSVTAHLGNTDMKFSVGLNKVFIAGSIVGAISGAGQVGQTLHQRRVGPAPGREPGAKTLYFCPVFVHFVEFMQGDVADKIALVGHETEQILLL